MSCCGHCRDAGNFFDQRTARREMKRYKRRGPEASTQKLIDAIAEETVEGLTLLDVGGGIGAIPFELFNKGLAKAVNVDASGAYQTAAMKEATERGLQDRTAYHFGDAVELVPHRSPADIVTLDRVICCYPDYQALLESTLPKAKRWYGLVFPKENGLTKVGVRLVNSWFWLKRSEFRTFIHPTQSVEQIIRSHGFE
ncbi:MAG: methyltransferase domain-containing protein, partial [Balneolaceae bacterium]